MKLSDAIKEGKPFYLNGEDDPSTAEGLPFEIIDDLDKALLEALYDAYDQGFTKAKYYAKNAVDRITR